MDTGIIIRSLVEFYSASEIRSIWKQALDAYNGRSTAATTITATSFEAQSTSFAVINTPAEALALMTACEAALRQLTGQTTVPADQVGVGVDFSKRHVSC